MVTTAPNLTQGRTTVSEEIGAVPVVPLKWFLGNLLPRRSKAKDGLNVRAKDVKKALISNGAWRKQTPGASKLEENEIFQSFRLVVEAIRKATGDSRVNSYVSQPNTTPFSERNNTSRPDGFFVLGDVAEATRPSWPDITGSAEFELKRDEDACRDNNNKIIWSMHHVMREDARRRFTFGITIEDTSTRFWFASRSVVLVSSRFDFMEEPGPLIRMVTFPLYASEEQLGYDMTMRRHGSQFAIDLNGRTFQTTGLLADFADSPLGRGTRVWQGFFTDDPERKSAVLKDCWAECDRELEGDVLATLREKYAKLRKRNKPNFDDHFLTVAAHGKIRLTGGLEDDTHAMMNGRLPVADDWLDITHNSKQPPRSAGVGMGPDPQEAKRTVDRELDIKKRCHYRISFEEVGKPLHDVTNLRDYMAALRDTVIAIKILHWLGYVHRDISSGNVLLCNGRGKLTDLEYCKLSLGPGDHDVRTGTPNFISVEAAVCARLFAPRDHTAYSPPPFQYFTLHDVESVWWLLVFALVGNGITDESPNTDRENRQVEFARGLFPKGLTSVTREHYFTVFGQFAAKMHDLPPTLHPLFDIAENLRVRLTTEFTNAEKGVVLNLKGVRRTLSRFRQTFEQAMELAEGIVLIPGLTFERKWSVASSVKPARKDTTEGGAKKRQRKQAQKDDKEGGAKKRQRKQ